MTGCPSWCRATHEGSRGSRLHQRHWLIGEPVTVSLVLDDETVADIPGWDEPRIIVNAHQAASAALVPPGTAADLAGVFRCLGDVGLAIAIGEAVTAARSVHAREVRAGNLSQHVLPGGDQ